MWQLIRSEFDYNRSLFLILLAPLPFLSYLSVHPILEDLPATMIVFWLMFNILLQWTIRRNKEYRDYRLMCLPCPVRYISALRILVLLAYFGLVAVIYLFFQALFNEGILFSAKSLVVYISINLVLLSIYLILKDISVSCLSNNRWLRPTREQRRMMLMFFILVLNLAGFYLLIQSSGGGRRGIGSVIDFIIHHHPFRGEFGYLRFFLVAVLLGFLSMVSFRWRRSYLEYK